MLSFFGCSDGRAFEVEPSGFPPGSIFVLALQIERFGRARPVADVLAHVALSRRIPGDDRWSSYYGCVCPRDTKVAVLSAAFQTASTQR